MPFTNIFVANKLSSGREIRNRTYCLHESGDYHEVKSVRFCSQNYKHIFGSPYKPE